ncbi:MAG: hypothetical protein Q8R37_03265 [Nanoarchaeota archaeon]|nr:hypothetical protein [Nanoarchaeota archaeon]
MDAAVQSSWKKAVKHYDAAEYFLNVTYPSLKDPILFIGIITNIFSSLEAAMDSVLIHGQNQGMVPKGATTFLEKLRVFRSRSAQQHAIPHEYLHLMADIKNVLDFHKKSPIEFRRKGTFFICAKEYEIQSLTITDIRSHLYKAQEFLKLVEVIINSRY